MPRHRVYVIRLDDAVISDRNFAARNPDHVSGKPCVYVGSSGLSPEERFKRHKDGIKSNRFVRKYGLYLMKRAYRNYPAETWPEILNTEKSLAHHLRKKGYAVWQA